MKQDDLVTVSIVIGILGAIGTGMLKLFKKSSKIDDNEKAINELEDSHDKKLKDFQEYCEKSFLLQKEAFEKENKDLRESIEVVKNSDIKNLNNKVDTVVQSVNDVQTNLSNIMTSNHQEILKMFISLGKKEAD